MKPMLAKRYEHFKNRLSFPLYIQPKLNGVRCLYHYGTFQSRDEHVWQSDVLKHLHKQLEKVPAGLILDGELYRHGWSLQEINGAVSINRNQPSSKTHLVKYNIFDCVVVNDLDLPFSKRLNILKALSPQLGIDCPIVETRRAETPDEADYAYSLWKSQDYEGLMYRDDVPYGLLCNCSNQENRWPCLIKRKNWLDEDCEIIDVEEGEGKYNGMVGSLVLLFPENNRVFRAGSGLSDLQRSKYMDQPPIGYCAKIKYEMLSNDGTPLKPTIEAVMD